MNCEMCGKAANAKGTVEGVTMTVCAACAKYATNVRALQQPAKPGKKVIASNDPPREEIIETVRPDFAKILRQHRESLKLNQEQFADKLKIRASTYNHFESGIAPPIETARKLQQALGVQLVVHMKVASSAPVKGDESRGFNLGDFIKRK